ncbi:sugar phosphate isomerase/epimerase [Anaerolinea thermophila]|jgi:sugar phosphate isomerase/epimerase|uniref:sugar phosphate isomerase/epimerase family protein n=1 Tax=Anaerolinea thermophila TaxID=167964 RepID=UPI0026EC9E7B|nr:TIM barrel protein [Anaerolinea thermophila]
MRLGGPLFQSYHSPEEWVAVVQKYGYRAVYCPVDVNTSLETIRQYEIAAQRADLIIAEVGAWSNPLSPDEQERQKALTLCKQALALADEIGALCAVNISGSRGDKWDGPDPRNLTAETFDMIVQTVRDILDSVKPRRAYYTLEPMPWMYPDSVDHYLDLIRAINRPMFGVHLDPVNLINSPQRYFENARLIKDCFERLGPWIKSCHAKDILLRPHLTTHLDEVRPGLGGLDYRTFLREAHRLPQDVPLMLEHMTEENDYLLAAQYIRQIASEEGLSL